MSEINDNSVGELRFRHGAKAPVIELALPAGVALEKIFADQRLIDSIRKLGPRGCQTCISGREFLLNSYEEVIRVEFGR
jgi:hypothetical protein